MPIAHSEPPRAKIAPKNSGWRIWYGLISAIAAVLIFRAFWGLRSWRKINLWTAKARPVSDRALENVHTAEELQAFLQNYAHARRGISKNAPLERIFAMLSGSWTAREADDVDVITKRLTAALYAGGTIDVEDLKTRCRRIIAGLKRKANGRRNSGEKLPRLNPT